MGGDVVEEWKVGVWGLGVGKRHTKGSGGER